MGRDPERRLNDQARRVMAQDHGPRRLTALGWVALAFLMGLAAAPFVAAVIIVLRMI